MSRQAERRQHEEDKDADDRSSPIGDPQGSAMRDRAGYNRHVVRAGASSKGE